ncbi:MAG: hypothetical protein E7291_04980 [Lachnospiraceae bacterium]|nr:hypothetical protein [Lachnospiraceae bacterium]
MKGDYAKERKPMQTRARLSSYLEGLQKSGVEFFIDGEAVLPRDIMQRTVQEQYAYMADYVLGENGKVQQVRFDRVEL